MTGAITDVIQVLTLMVLSAASIYGTRHRTFQDRRIDLLRDRIERLEDRR